MCCFEFISTNLLSGDEPNELDKLKREMGILNRMNEDQQRKLDEQRTVLKRRNEDASELDRRIEELTNRLRQKKLSSNQSVAPPTSRIHTIVAAVEPLMKKAEPNIKVSGFFFALASFLHFISWQFSWLYSNK